MRTPRTTIAPTGTARATCGCEGVVLDKATRTTGQWPVVSMRITTPCPTCHVSAGIIARFTPRHVQQQTRTAP